MCVSLEDAMLVLILKRFINPEIRQHTAMRFGVNMAQCGKIIRHWFESSSVHHLAVDVIKPLIWVCGTIRTACECPP